MEKEWFKNWFDTTYYHTLYGDRSNKEAKLFIDKLLTFLAPKKSAVFLDIACGKGRHSTQIFEHEHNVIGYDLSESSITEAKINEQKGLSFYTHDMRNLFRTNYFDYALNLFTSFGYFNTTRDEQNAILSASKSLKKGGTFVIEFFKQRQGRGFTCRRRGENNGQHQVYH